jgi:LysM repeat protein
VENFKRVILLLKAEIMRKQLSWLLLCLFTVTVVAQDKLVLVGKAPSMYVNYTVGTETSLKNISNQFGQSITRLAAYNELTLNTVLSKGAKIKIPVTEYNLLRTKGDGTNAPVYYIVEKGDNLFHLSKTNNVTIANLREWNGLKTDAVKLGQPMIIGFMANVKASDIKAGEPRKEELKKPEETTAAKPDSKPAIKKEEPQKIVASEPAAKADPKPVAKKDPPANKTETPAVAEKETKMPVAASEPIAIKRELSSEYAPKEGDEGYFAAVYTQHLREQSKQFHSGDAATFKTISGWTDRKYYVLINDVAPETIVRITAPNNKSICAKVLGPLQETKGANGLLLRMSNSAASTLGITDPKFTVTVTFFE